MTMMFNLTKPRADLSNPLANTNPEVAISF